ncbi:hypothetical protein ANO11243_033830 [Dothideomycetidae sp. 11243]|nr:hypothetical protein ANO11243_033830 [fungal sp. No.11243]
MSAVQAALVNHAWAEQATRILWRRPYTPALATLSPDRLERLATYVQYLSFIGNRGQEAHEALAQAAFPHLRCVHFESDKALEAGTISKYLQPGLETLKLVGGYGVRFPLLTLLHDSCPNLQRLTLRLEGIFEKATSLLTFLQTCQSIHTIAIDNCMRHLVSADVLCHLAVRENLQSIELPSYLPLADIRMMFEEVPNPFSQVKHFTMAGREKDLLRFLPHLTSCTHLTLPLYPLNRRAQRVSQHIAALHRLRTLEISFTASAKIYFKDLLVLGFLMLHRFTISRTFSVDDSAREFNPGSAIDTGFFSAFPELREFAFLAGGTFDTALALHRLGRACPYLENCNFREGCDFVKLPDTGPPLFPRLKALTVGWASMHSRTRRRARSVFQLLHI